MEHHHDHHHSTSLTNVTTAFVVGIGLNLLFLIIEAVVGYRIDSLALLTDAGHNLSDVASLILSLIAFKLMKVKSTESYTYGFSKATILVALLNAVILLIAVASIVFEAIHRLNNPQNVPGKTIAIVAGIGIIINAFTAYLFMKDKEQDLNIKSAYLHLAADALVSAGVVIGGITMMYTNWLWLDTAISLLIAIVILVSTWNLLSESLRLALDGVPANVDMEAIKTKIKAKKGVRDFTHIHVWALSTTKNALTAQLVVEHGADLQTIETLKKSIKHDLAHLNIQHATIETLIGKSEQDDCAAEEL